VAELVGVEHVGIGLDYIYDRKELDDLLAGNPEKFPPHLGYGSGMQMMAPEQLPELATELYKRGMSDLELASVLGGNWLRIAETVWKR
jgi:membrane dipeptidase